LMNTPSMFTTGTENSRASRFMTGIMFSCRGKTFLPESSSARSKIIRSAMSIPQGQGSRTVKPSTTT